MKVGATGLVSLLATALALFVAGAVFAGPVDSDGDGITDDVDNCPTTFNPSQTNSDVASDAPGDAHGDACDNCRNLCNTLQIDTGFEAQPDGCGNECDGDVNNDGVVGLPDFAQLAMSLGTTAPPSSPEKDLTGLAGTACGAQGITIPDGIVGLPDFARLAMFLGSPPGPGIPPDTDCDGDGLP